MKINIGQAQTGPCVLDLSNSAGIRLAGSPGVGKSTLIETIAIASKKQEPKIRIIIISTTGRFDYTLPFEFEFFNIFKDKEKAFEVLEDLKKEMFDLLNQMETLNTKDVTKVSSCRATLLIVDELENVEDLLEKKERDEFARLITFRINSGRKLKHWTVTATQSQILDATATKTRSFDYTFIGRPQTLAMCHSLGIDEKYYHDQNLKKGRLLMLESGNCQVVIIRKDNV